MKIYRITACNCQGEEEILTYAGEAATDVLAVLRSAHGVGMFPTPTGWNVVTADSDPSDRATLVLRHDNGSAMSYLIMPTWAEVSA